MFITATHRASPEVAKLLYKLNYLPSGLALCDVINRRSKASAAAFETLPSGTGLSARQKISPGEKSGFVKSRFVIGQSRISLGFMFSYACL